MTSPYPGQEFSWPGAPGISDLNLDLPHRGWSHFGRQQPGFARRLSAPGSHVRVSLRGAVGPRVSAMDAAAELLFYVNGRQVSSPGAPAHVGPGGCRGAASRSRSHPPPTRHDPAVKGRVLRTAPDPGPHLPPVPFPSPPKMHELITKPTPTHKEEKWLFSLKASALPNVPQTPQVTGSSL